MNASIARPDGSGARETRRTATCPSVSLPAGPGRVAVEVNLVARLGQGAGDKLYCEAQARQCQHGRFVDALDEPSAKLGSTDFLAGEERDPASFVRAMHHVNVRPDCLSTSTASR